MTRFDLLQQQMQTDTSVVSPITQDIIRDELRADITRFAASYSDPLSDMYDYVAAICTLMNRQDWAHSFLKQGISEADEILIWLLPFHLPPSTPAAAPSTAPPISLLSAFPPFPAQSLHNPLHYLFCYLFYKP